MAHQRELLSFRKLLSSFAWRTIDPPARLVARQVWYLKNRPICQQGRRTSPTLRFVHLSEIAVVLGVEESGTPRGERPPPHRTVRAVFPHTARRVGLVSSVSLPFAPRLRFTLIPMDAPPYSFVWRDSPTSVTHPLARPSGRLWRGPLRKAFAFLRCISARLTVLTVC